MTFLQLSGEINNYKCSDSSCSADAGGCFRKNFEFENDVHESKMKKCLFLFREKTRCLDKTDKDTFGLRLFREHCTNISEVISVTEDVFAGLNDQVHCGVCQSLPPCECGE